MMVLPIEAFVQYISDVEMTPTSVGSEQQISISGEKNFLGCYFYESDFRRYIV